ncbi:MAG: TonB family protein [Dokdonella sp.]
MNAFAPVWLSSLEIIGWSLLHFLWQGCVVGGLYSLVRSQLPSERADLRYAAGLVALGLLALCLPITVAVLASSEPVALATASASALTLETVGAGAPSAFDIDALMPWLVSLWSLGVLVFALRAVREMRSYARIIATSSSNNPRIDQMLEQVALRVGYLRKVRVLISDRIDTPTLFGWIRPVILLPTAVVLQFPRQQLELILAHELSHLRRYDHYINLAQTVVETLLFYHPVVHWIARDVRHEREVCCDRLVLGTDRAASGEYVRTLAALQELRLQTSPLVLAASGGFLLDRVQRILLSPDERPQQTRSNASYWIVLTMLLGGALLVTFQLREQRAALERLGAALLEKLPRPQAALVFDLALDISRDLAITLPARERLVLAVSPAVVERAGATPVANLASTTVQAAALGASASNTAIAEKTLVDNVVAASATRLASDAPTFDKPIGASAVPVAATPELPLPAPRLMRRITPKYPDIFVGGSQGHVEFEFSLASDGSVKNVVVVSGDADGRFAAAARAALVQWQFAPASVSAGLRLRQDFQFRETSAVADNNSVACRRNTGSHICPESRRR